MLLAALFALAPIAHAADCGPPTFAFVGQPACVSLEFDGARTQLHNGCAAPLLVDVSVLAGAGGSPAIPAGGSAELRDLSFFTMGLDGEIHKAVAVVEAAECAAPVGEPVVEVAPEAEAEPGFFQAVLAVVLPG